MKKSKLEKRVRSLEYASEDHGSDIKWAFVLVLVISALIVFLAFVNADRFSIIEAQLASDDNTSWECVEWRTALFTNQLIINGEPVTIGFVTQYNTTQYPTEKDLEDVLIGLKIVTHTFGDQPVVQIDGIKRTCTKEQLVRKLT